MRIAVLHSDAYLWQKIRLTLYEAGETVERITEKSEDTYDICIYDSGLTPPAERAARLISVGRDESAELKIPFAYSELLSLCLEGNRERSGPSLVPGDKCVYFEGVKIPLTDVEHKLLSVLVRAGGEYVGREELIGEVWGDGTGGSVLNVYVHYLREKLEKDKKVILSSRKGGYCIDRKFLETDGIPHPVSKKGAKNA